MGFSDNDMLKGMMEKTAGPLLAAAQKEQNIRAEATQRAFDEVITQLQDIKKETETQSQTMIDILSTLLEQNTYLSKIMSNMRDIEKPY